MERIRAKATWGLQPLLVTTCDQPCFGSGVCRMHGKTHSASHLPGAPLRIYVRQLKYLLLWTYFTQVDKLMSCMMTNNINEPLCIMGSCTIQALLFWVTTHFSGGIHRAMHKMSEVVFSDTQKWWAVLGTQRQIIGKCSQLHQRRRNPDKQQIFYHACANLTRWIKAHSTSVTWKCHVHGCGVRAVTLVNFCQLDGGDRRVDMTLKASMWPHQRLRSPLQTNAVMMPSIENMQPFTLIPLEFICFDAVMTKLCPELD